MQKCDIIEEAKQRMKFLLYNYTASERNLAELSNLGKLHRVDLTYAKIDSLDGIEDLICLNRLVINHSRTLKSIQALSGHSISQTLKDLELDHCPNIVTYSPIGSLTHLESLVIRECKTVIQQNS